MQRDSYAKELLAHEETFYAEFWRSEAWGSATPNEDESARARVLLQLMHEHVAPALRGRDEVRLLDVGCGRGWLTKLLSQFGSARGIDPVAAAIERAKDLFPDLDFAQGYSDDLIEQGLAGAFDVVVSSEVIEHVPDDAKPAFLASLYDLLAQQGFCLLTTPRGELFDWWSGLGYPHQPVESWVTEPKLRALAEAAGFRVLAQRRVWVPNQRYSLGARAVASRYWRALRPLAPKAFDRGRSRFGIYQVILLQKD